MNRTGNGLLGSPFFLGGYHGGSTTGVGDAFGNALGQSIADEMQPGVDWSNAPDQSDAETARLNRYEAAASTSSKTFAQDVAERRTTAQIPDWVRDSQGSAALSLLKDAQGIVSDDVWGMGSPPFGTIARVNQQKVVDEFNFAQRTAYNNVINQLGGSTDGAIAAGQLVGLKQRFDALAAGLSSSQVNHPDFVQARRAFNDMLLAYDSYFVQSVPELLPADTSRVRGKALVNLAPSAVYDDADSGFSASLYLNKKSGHYTLAFRGTDNLAGVKADYTQALGWPTKQYDQAVDLATRLSLGTAIGDNLSFTGHSLGGGLASIAALRTGLPANTFNAAGLNPVTALRYDAEIDSAPNLINAYFVRGEKLSAVQDAGPVKIGLPTAYAATLPYPRMDLPQFDPMATRVSVVEVDLPEAVGRRIGLVPNQPASPLTLHGSAAVLEALYRSAFPGQRGRP